MVRSVVRTAKVAVGDLPSTITHEPWASQDEYGKPTYGTAVSRDAVVEIRTKAIRNTGGELVMARASVQFLEDVAIDMRDRLTLPDGTTSPIVAITGVIDPSTTSPYSQVVWIGQDAPVAQQ